MENQPLLTMLQELRAELSQTPEVDSDTLARLDTLTDDIRRKIGEQAGTSTPSSEADSNVLNELLLKFEAEHPQLSVSIGRVADALAAMGF